MKIVMKFPNDIRIVLDGDKLIGDFVEASVQGDIDDGWLTYKMKKPTIEERTTDILNDESFEEVVMDTGWEELAPYVIDGPYVADENLFDVHSYDFAVSIEN